MDAVLSDAPFLAEVERSLTRRLDDEAARCSDEQALLPAVARYLCLAGGAKRARPQLCLWCGTMVGAPQPALVDVAVATELIHSASLLHDDVVDAGKRRRGRPTANVRWGNTVAVLAGDLLLSTALDAVRRHPPGIIARAVEVVAEMSRAALAEVLARGRVDLPLASWRAIAEGKTGALFGFCGHAAALLAGDAAAAARFDRAGRRLGVAFQIADDLHDLLGTDPGKERFADIRERTPTYPLIVAAISTPSVREALAAAWADDPVRPALAAAAGRAVLASDAIANARAAIVDEVAAAREALGTFGEQALGRELLRRADRLGKLGGAG